MANHNGSSVSECFKHRYDAIFYGCWQCDYDGKQPELFRTWCDRTKKLGQHPAICFFPRGDDTNVLLVVCSADFMYLSEHAGLHVAQLYWKRQAGHFKDGQRGTKDC